MLCLHGEAGCRELVQQVTPAIDQLELFTRQRPFAGPAEIAQFETLALPGPGLILAIIASGLVVAGLYYHRKAYKPLVDAAREAERSAQRSEA